MTVISQNTKTSRTREDYGTVALDGSNPTTVTVNNWSAIVDAQVTIKTSSALGDATHQVTVDWSGNVLSIYGWKPVSGSDPTLVASDGTETVAYHIWGY